MGGGRTGWENLLAFQHTHRSLRSATAWILNFTPSQLTRICLVGFHPWIWWSEIYRQCMCVCVKGVSWENLLTFLHIQGLHSGQLPLAATTVSRLEPNYKLPPPSWFVTNNFARSCLASWLLWDTISFWVVSQISCPYSYLVIGDPLIRESMSWIPQIHPRNPQKMFPFNISGGSEVAKNQSRF